MEEKINECFPFVIQEGEYYNVGDKKQVKIISLSILELKRLQLKIAKIIYDKENN